MVCGGFQASVVGATIRRWPSDSASSHTLAYAASGRPLACLDLAALRTRPGPTTLARFQTLLDV